MSPRLPAGYRYQSGVTLVELMIAVAVMFILTAVAVPLYQGYLSNTRDAALRQKVEAFRMFQNDYRIDNGTYLAGEYVPGGSNDFAALGYRVEDDASGITLEVEAGSCGTIADCYKVTAENAEGRRYIWDNGAETWEN